VEYDHSTANAICHPHFRMARLGSLASSAGGAVEVFTILYGLQLVPVALGSAIGTPIGKKLEQRLQH
jgi:hypothetical protein